MTIASTSQLRQFQPAITFCTKRNGPGSETEAMSETAVLRCDEQPTHGYPGVAWRRGPAGAVRAEHKGCEITIWPDRTGAGIMFARVTCTSWECVNRIEIHGDEEGALSVAKDMAVSFAERVGER